MRWQVLLPIVVGLSTALAVAGLVANQRAKITCVQTGTRFDEATAGTADDLCLRMGPATAQFLTEPNAF